MNDKNKLKDLSSHFRFGENWHNFSKLLSPKKIKNAEDDLSRLFPVPLSSNTFLDIGSGSGLHSLAALRLGVSHLTALDIDPISCNTTSDLLLSSGYTNHNVLNISIFDFHPNSKFDFVYSWGVLHHTGDMWSSIDNASRLVSDDGYLCLALYRKTWLDFLWKIEKRFYSRRSKSIQHLIFTFYVFLFKFCLVLSGRDYQKYISNYSTRGMDFYIDAHDWLGGWPYESTNLEELEPFLNNRGFTLVSSFTRKPTFAGRDVGILGTGCDEFIFKKA